MRATTVFGVPLYNNAPFLEEAVGSLLAQTRSDLAVVLVDDASTDGTEAIGRALAGRDARITYHRNKRRVGMVDNWRRAFALARAAYPDAPYFAWGSDHDRWEPLWLERLAAVLDADASLAAAYPWHGRLDETGAESRPKTPPRWETRGTRWRLARVASTIVFSKPGSIVYGLFRADAVERAGVFHRTLSPDRLLLAEIALHGEVAVCPDLLWWRRFRQDVTPARQRRMLFGEGVPRWSHTPWYMQHAAVLGWRLGVRGDDRSTVPRPLGLAAALVVPPLALARAVRLDFSAARRASRRVNKRLRAHLGALRADDRSAAD